MWALLLAAQAKSLCPTTTYFTDCDISLKQKAVITSTADCAEYPLVIDSVPCNKDCPPGSFFEVSQSKQDCSLCPAGSFSVGGGFSYGREGVAWTVALNSILNDCWIKQGNSEYHNYACVPWQIEDGILSSNGTSNNGQFNPYENSTYTASLSFGLQVVKPGNFSVKYRKDTYRINGKRVGEFVVSKNFEKMLEDSQVDQSTWKELVFPLEVGFVEVVIDYKTRRSEVMTNPKAYIAEIQVTGTKFADYECYVCPNGGTAKGATKCEICGFNEYLEAGLCLSCPEGFYSYKGSVSSSACQPRFPCTEQDYKPVYSPCVETLRTLTYEWREPVFCDTSNSTLPPFQSVPCEECKEGYFKNLTLGVTVCATCQPGHVLNQTCTPCPAGTFARKQVNITDWSDLPKNFSTTCKTFHGAPCLHSLGWVPLTNYLTTGLAKHAASELFLDILVYVHSSLGFLKVDYRFVTEGGGQIDVYVDGHQQDQWTSGNSGLNFVYLGQGLHTVQLVYWNQNGALEEVRINSIILSGTDEGAALMCLQCEEGYISKEGSSSCLPCPAGSSSNTERTICSFCIENTVSFRPGGRCLSCPTGTRSNRKKTSCIGTEFVYLGNYSYYIRNITGIKDKEGEYNGGICEMASTKLYCHQTFYGPIPGNESEFYLSVLNPTQLNLPNSEFIYKNSTGYAYLIYDAKANDQCFDNRKILNLGKTVLGITPAEKGFTVNYAFGDECENGGFYGSSLSLVCDKATGIGWPVLESNNSCVYQFTWKSKYGCPVCLFHKMKEVRSACVNGMRTIKKIEYDDCILAFDGQIEWKESCSEVSEALKTWPMIVGLFLLAVLILISIISLVFYYKYKRGFDKLKEVPANI